MEIKRIGLGLVNNRFEIHGVDADGEAVLQSTLTPREMLVFFRGLPRCLVGLEACGGAHQWVRILRALGHDTRLIPPHLVAVHRVGGVARVSNAQAICDATADRFVKRRLPFRDILAGLSRRESR